MSTRKVKIEVIVTVTDDEKVITIDESGIHTWTEAPKWLTNGVYCGDYAKKRKAYITCRQYEV